VQSQNQAAVADLIASRVTKGADGYRQRAQARLHAEHSREQLLRDEPGRQSVQADVDE
jgi:hypothetical protein